MRPQGDVRDVSLFTIMVSPSLFHYEFPKKRRIMKSVGHTQGKKGLS